MGPPLMGQSQEAVGGVTWLGTMQSGQGTHGPAPLACWSAPWREAESSQATGSPEPVLMTGLSSMSGFSEPSQPLAPDSSLL